MSNVNALQNSNVVITANNGLTFSTAGTYVLGGLSGAGTEALGTGDIIQVGNNNADTSYTVALSGAGGLIKSGTGTLTLGAADTFTGGLTINSGTVAATNAAGFGGTGGVGTITLGAGSGSANATVGGLGAGPYLNPITVASGSSGTLTIASVGVPAAVFSAAVTLNNNVTLASTGGNSLTISGGITGTGNITLKNGSFTNGITLSTVAVNNAGTVTNSGVGTGTSAISAAPAPNVTGVTENSLTSALTISGGEAIKAATTLTLTNSNALGVALLTESGGITSSGAYNLVLNNNSAINGGITLSGAAILINNTGTITNSGTGTGSTVISAIIGTNVTGVVENGTSADSLGRQRQHDRRHSHLGPDQYQQRDGLGRGGKHLRHHHWNDRQHQRRQRHRNRGQSPDVERQLYLRRQQQSRFHDRGGQPDLSITADECRSEPPDGRRRHHLRAYPRAQ